MPEYDDGALYEKLVLDGFQAGLSWITILRKRENFRRGLRRFRTGKDRALSQAQDREPDEGRRHRAQSRKIEGAVGSARAWLDIMEKGPGFSNLLWDFLDGKPKQNHFRTTKLVPAETRSRARCRRS